VETLTRRSTRLRIFGAALSDQTVEAEMAKKNTDLADITDDIAPDAMEEISGGVIQRPLSPIMDSLWQPDPIEALPEITFGSGLVGHQLELPGNEAESSGSGPDDNASNQAQTSAGDDDTPVTFTLHSTGGKELPKDAPKIAKALHTVFR
jgi:hypothetical protein